jgi:putative hydrolase of the HAD superfamily
LIKAITFDFWDTIVKDDSDEPKRAARGLAGKAETRLQLLTSEITYHHPHFKSSQVREAFDYANNRFRHHWKVEHFTPSVNKRFQKAYAFLKIDPTPGFADVVRKIEAMEVEIPPDFAPGIHEVLPELAQVRQILERAGLLQHFSHWVFSDEAGASKPAPSVFEQASAGLGVPLNQIAHVGDRESNDIAGPLAMGMAAILYTGVIDRGSARTQATAICRNYAELPGLIKQMAN